MAIFSITWEMSDIPGQNTPKGQRDEHVGERLGLDQTLHV